MGTFLTIIIKFLTKSFCLIFLTITADAQQQATTVGISSIKQHRGIYAIPGVAASYSPTTGIINIPTYTFIPVEDSVVTVTRGINSSTYTPHPTKQVTVSYNVEISCTATIGSNSSGRALFQYSTNGGGVWIDGGEVRNSNTVTLAVALQSVTIQTAQIYCTIPPGALCRIVPTTTGTTTITWLRGQEKYNGY